MAMYQHGSPRHLAVCMNTFYGVTLTFFCLFWSESDKGKMKIFWGVKLVIFFILSDLDNGL